jgi:hypothetical protein
MPSQRAFLRNVFVACAPLLVWVIHFAALYAAAAVVPEGATCAPAGARWTIWLATAVAAGAIVYFARRAVLWVAPRGRELRLVQIAAVTNAVLALTAVVWAAASIALQVQWCE